MRKIPLLLAFSVALLIPALAQAPPLHAQVDNEFVQQQFGRRVHLLPEFAPVFGDLDGDGVEDVAIAARCKNPMLDQAEHNYTVLDPYYEFFGYGDPQDDDDFQRGRSGAAWPGCVDYSWQREGRLALSHSQSEIRDCEFAV